LARSSTFDPASGTFTVAGRTTAVFNILHEQPTPEPVATATQAESSAAPENNMPLTIVAVVGGLIAVIAFMFALRRRDNRQ